MKKKNWRAVTISLGVCLLAVSAVAANRLLYAQTPSNSPGEPRGPIAKPKNRPVGLTVLGTVDVPGGVVRIDAPALPALSGLTVKDVLVHDGKDVKINEELIIFDNSLFKEKVAQANAGLAAAREDLKAAEAQLKDYPKQLELLKLAYDTSSAKHMTAQATYDIEEKKLLDTKRKYDGSSLTEAEKEKERNENLELRNARMNIATLKSAAEKDRLEYERLKDKPINLDIDRALAKIALMQSTLRDAEAAVAICTIKSQVSGVAEQVLATKGMTFGPTTRIPALYIVPNGPRIVRAEIDAEFAQKIADKLGKKVTICDQHNDKWTYEGEVTRIGTSFLPKRGSTETFNVNPTRILECEIRILNTKPKDQDGKDIPPLLVGQPVRIEFAREPNGQ